MPINMIKPCNECPFRRDTPPGKFSAERYEALLSTVGERGAEAALDAPLFACHKTPEGQEKVCAGWLAVCGHEHLGVRLAVIKGDIEPVAALWCEHLFDNYEEMRQAQGGAQ